MPATSARKPRVATRRKPAAKRLLNIGDLTRFKSVIAPMLSPDGERMVFVVKTVGSKNEYKSNLWMVDTAGGKARRFSGGDKDSAPAWSPDGEQLAFISGRTKGSPQIALIPADGGEARVLTCFPEGSLSGFRWSPDGTRLAVSFRPTAERWTSDAREARKKSGQSDPPRVLDDPWYRLDGDGYFDAQRFGLYLVDVASGDHRLLHGPAHLDIHGFDFSPDGKQLAVITSSDKKVYARWWNAEVARIDVASGKLRPVRGVPSGPKDTVRWSPDGGRLAISCQPDEDGSHPGRNMELLVAELKTGKCKSLTASEDYCLSAPTISDVVEVSFVAQLQWAPDGKRVYMQIGWHGECHVASVGVRGGPLRFHTTGRKQHMLGNLSRDGRRIALLVGTATRPPDVHVSAVPAASATGARAHFAPRALSDVNKALLSELKLSQPSSRWVRSADGTRVQVWTMLPPGASGKRKLPTVLQIHGGPATQYGWTFFHEFQMLAAQGYAIVFSNPRGSKGYGQALCDGNTHAWGVKDWADVEAVIADMQTRPWCDVKRMGISGGSFGGFMTLWAIGHTNVFRAAVADRCVSNMVSMWGASDVYIWPDSFMPGNTWDDTKPLWDMSPLKHLGKARTPTLIIHSEGDLRCNIAESEQAYAALALRGVPTRFVRYPRNTSHGMSRAGPPDMRIHRLEQYLGWWDHYLKGKKQPGRRRAR
jgi:dipeptidyl aminopeptidase/acylaminoacyl peptidase